MDGRDWLARDLEEQTKQLKRLIWRFGLLLILSQFVLIAIWVALVLALT